MQITSIKQQVKRVDRYSIYIDGAYVLSLSESELLRLGLRIGQELDANELAELKQDSVQDKARFQALNQLSRRMRSTWELQDYLKRKGYEPEVIERVLSELKGYGYINDVKFAEAWVANRRLLKSVSSRRLQQELRQKRVSDAVISLVLAEDETDESAVLKELVARKRKQKKYQDDLKLAQYLVRQGFQYDEVKTALASPED